MSTIPPPSPRAEFAAGTDPGRTLGWWGAVMAAVTIGMALLTLLFAYVYLGVNAGAWPPPGVEPPDPRPALLALLPLLASVAAAAGATAAARRGRQMVLQLALAATVLLGIVFLALQAAGYRGMDLDATAHAYASAFWLIVAVHHLVTVATLAGLALQGLLVWGRPSQRVVSGVESLSLLWHWHVAMWVAVAVVLYGSPLVWPGGGGP